MNSFDGLAHVKSVAKAEAKALENRPQEGLESDEDKRLLPRSYG